MEEEERPSGSSAFGTLLRRHRLAVGLSQEALAERAGMSTQGIGALERGDRRTPQRKTLELLAAVLRLDKEQSRRFEAAAARPGVMRSGDGRAAKLPPEAPDASGAPNNLPRRLTSFVGRETVVAEIVALVARSPLVTLVGSAGIGKTRTSLQVGGRLLGGYADGVWFVELAPLSSGAYLPTTLAQAMGLQLPGDGDPRERIVAALERRQMLLIFDNCEHLLEPVAELAAALLRECPQVRILASTRQSLGVSGEAVYRIPSLAVPVAGIELAAGDAGRYAALDLFLQRACAADARFVATDENVAAIADICRKLDGLPLAIELAAARIPMLGPRLLRDRLDERFRLLRGGRDLVPRQQTLRAAIDWSYDLLDEPERALFRQLSVFVDGFALEGAVAITAGDGEHDEIAVFDVLASLVDKSLVLAEPAGDAVRYRMFESTRAYAREKLAGAGEEPAAAMRHLRYVRDIFVAARSLLAHNGRTAALEFALSTELEDLRAALDFAAESPEPELGGELLEAIRTTWDWVGLGREGMARLERFIALLPAAKPRLPAMLSRDLACLRLNDGQGAKALEAATESVRLARMSGDAETLAYTLFQYAGALTLSLRFAEAEAAVAEGETVAPTENPHLAVSLLETRAFLCMFSGDLEGSAPVHAELRRRQRELGNTRKATVHALNLAEVEHKLGRSERAVAIVQEELASVRTSRDRGTLIGLLLNLAGYLSALDRRAEARAVATEVLRLGGARDPAHLHVTVAIEPLALARALEGEPQVAAQLAGYTEAALKRLGFEREFTEQTTRSALERALREAVPPAELSDLFAKGAVLAADEALALALGTA